MSDNRWSCGRAVFQGKFRSKIDQSMVAPHGVQSICPIILTVHTSMGQCKKDVTPLLTHWSYVFLALTHQLCCVCCSLVNVDFIHNLKGFFFHTRISKWLKYLNSAEYTYLSLIPIAVTMFFFSYQNIYISG